MIRKEMSEDLPSPINHPLTPSIRPKKQTAAKAAADLEPTPATSPIESKRKSVSSRSPPKSPSSKRQRVETRVVETAELGFLRRQNPREKGAAAAAAADPLPAPRAANAAAASEAPSERTMIAKNTGGVRISEDVVEVLSSGTLAGSSVGKRKIRDVSPGTRGEVGVQRANDDASVQSLRTKSKAVRGKKSKSKAKPEEWTKLWAEFLELKAKAKKVHSEAGASERFHTSANSALTSGMEYCRKLYEGYRALPEKASKSKLLQSNHYFFDNFIPRTLALVEDDITKKRFEAERARLGVCIFRLEVLESASFSCKLYEMETFLQSLPDKSSKLDSDAGDEYSKGLQASLQMVRRFQEGYKSYADMLNTDEPDRDPKKDKP
mmetsp:Transcript_5337/g.13907  ORF Transcript_5337/g.13907 Transcript_5337/m.13907 type:complete len:379 (-) Transcript_5337:211-1347(-)